MVRAVNYAEKIGGRFSNYGGWKTNLFGLPSKVSSPELQAYRVDMNAGGALDAHFHIVDQFQVFVAGSGTIGRERADSITVHYADHHTGYGPLVAEAQGLSYLTLRSKTDAGLVFLKEPHIRERLQPTKRRHRFSDRIVLSSDAVLLNRSEVTTEPVLDTQEGDDGMTALVVRMGPNMQAHAPHNPVSGGQYIIVVSGSLVADAVELKPFSLLFVRPEEDAPLLTAGSEGLEVLVTRFPTESEWMASI